MSKEILEEQFDERRIASKIRSILLREFEESFWFLSRTTETNAQALEKFGEPELKVSVKATVTIRHEILVEIDYKVVKRGTTEEHLLWKWHNYGTQGGGDGHWRPSRPFEDTTVVFIPLYGDQYTGFEESNKYLTKRGEERKIVQGTQGDEGYFLTFVEGETKNWGTTAKRWDLKINENLERALNAEKYLNISDWKVQIRNVSKR